MRQLNGYELFLMIGWPKNRLEELLKYDAEKLAEFAGAAFSGFAVQPVVSSALYALGKCGVTGDPEQELSKPAAIKGHGKGSAGAATGDSDTEHDASGSSSSEPGTGTD